MRIIATKVTAKDLKPGDLFSNVDQHYWDLAVALNAAVIGERVYIRTNAPCPEDQAEDEIYRIEIECGDVE